MDTRVESDSMGTIEVPASHYWGAQTRNGLKAHDNDNDKKEYRRAQAVFEKSEGKTHKAIAKEHGVDERTTQRWIAAYVKKGIEGLQICRNSRSKSSITDEDKEIILSALFNDSSV